MHQELVYLKQFNCTLQSEYTQVEIFHGYEWLHFQTVFLVSKYPDLSNYGFGAYKNSFLHSKPSEETELRIALVAYVSDYFSKPNSFFLTRARSLNCDLPVKNYQFKRLGLIFVGSNILDPIFFC